MTGRAITREFGNIVLDFLYKGNKSLNKNNLQKFLDKEKYVDANGIQIYEILATQLVYPDFSVKFGYNDPNKGWTKHEAIWSLKGS